MKRLGLLCLVAAACSDEGSPELVLPRHEIPAGVCEPALVGAAPASAEGISQYVWQVDETGIEVALSGAGGEDLGRLRTWLDIDFTRTGAWSVSTDYTVAGDAVVAQTQRFRLLGPDRLWLEIENRVGERTTFAWITLDANLTPIDITLARPDPSGSVVTPSGRFETFDFMVATETFEAEADAWIAAQGLDSLLADPLWQRFVHATDDPAWVEPASEQARLCQAGAAAGAEARLASQHALGCATQSRLEGAGNAWNLIGAVGSAMSITGALIGAGVIGSGLAIGATLVVAGVAAYYAGAAVEAAVNPNRDAVMGGAIDGAAGAYEALTGDALGTGAAKDFFVGSGSAKSSGDPHLDTFDGRAYDFQGAGEFVLARSDGFEVQVRQEPIDGLCDHVALNTGAAARLSGHRIAFYQGELKPWVDGQPVDIPGGAMAFADATLEQLGPSLWRLWWTTGEALEVHGGSALDVRVHVPDGRAGAMAGLLGDADGDPDNDIRLPDGTPLSKPVDWELLGGPYADSWRVDASTSLFDYQDGEGPETFVIPGFPSRPVTAADIPPVERATAESACAGAGIMNPVVLEDCVLDVACTGNSQFIDSHLDRDPDGRLELETPIFLDGWTVEGDPSNGNWQVTADGRAVSQATNGDPTFFVSPEEFFDTTVRGRLEVATLSDDDIIGFVFGYRSPLDENGDATNDYDTFVLSWKGGTQSGAEEGLTLSHAHGTITDIDSTFWQQTDTAEYTVLDTAYAAGRGWIDYTAYDFELSYGADGIVISIDGETLFDLAAADIPVALEPGRFGFYNYSQPLVTYSDFTVVADPGAGELSCANAVPFPDVPAAGALLVPGDAAYRVDGLVVLDVPVTIEAGALICMAADAQLSVNEPGSFTTRGTPIAPVRFTGVEKRAGFWSGIRFASESADNVLTWTEVAYAGGAGMVSVGRAGVAVDSTGQVRLDNVTIRDSAQWGLWSEGSNPVSVEGASAFVRNARAGALVDSAQVGGLSPAGRYIGGNGDGDTVWVSGGNVDGAMVWPALDATWHVNGMVNINAPAVISAGTRLQVVGGGGFNVGGSGSLTIAGTASQPVDIHAVSTSWRGIRYAAVSPENLIQHATISGGGGSAQTSVEPANVAVDSTGGVRIEDSTLSGSAAWGLWAEAGAGLQIVGANVFSANAQAGLLIAPEHMTFVDGVGQFAGGNGQDVVWVTGGRADLDGTWDALDVPYLLNGLVAIGGAISVEAGAEIRLDTDGAIDVQTGTLSAVGTSSAPIRFLGLTEAAGAHRGIRIAAPGSVMQFVEVAHGGGPAQVSVGAANLAVDSAGTLVLSDATVRDSAGWGLYEEGSVTATNLSFANNAGGDRGP